MSTMMLLALFMFHDVFKALVCHAVPQVLLFLRFHEFSLISSGADYVDGRKCLDAGYSC
jgi:hypothetical protein